MSEYEKTSGRITYYEPNVEFFANQKAGTNSDTILFPYEDYTMAVDLIVRQYNRYSCGLGKLGNDFKDFVYSTNDGTISFLGGTKQKNADGEYTDKGYLTTNYTDVSLTSPESNTQECLGIESIEITYQSWFYPQVTIKFIDVRGATVMEQAENAYYHSNELGSNSNLYKAFFSFPYPLFILKVKGFYGKGVTYKLSVSKTTIDFDASNGNFIITAEFIGHMYGVFADLPMTFLAVAPYTEIGKEYWNRKINERIFYFRGPGGVLETPMVTFPELRERIRKAINSAEAISIESEAVANESNVTEELDSANALVAMFDELYKDICFEVEDGSIRNRYLYIFCDKNYMEQSWGPRFKAFLDKLKEHELKFKTKEAGFDIYGDFNDIPNAFFTSPNNSKYNTVLKIKRLNNGEIEITSDGGNIYAYITDKVGVGHHYSEVVLNWVKTKIQPSNGNSVVLYHMPKRTQDFNNYNTFPNFNKIIHGEKWQNYINSLGGRRDELKEEAKQKRDAYLERALGFTPSIRNFYELAFAHMDTFLNFTYFYLEKIKDQLSSGEFRKKTHYGIDDADDNTDTEKTKIKSRGVEVATGIKRAEFLPPFVAYYKDNHSTDNVDSNGNVKKKVLRFPDELPNGQDLEEVQLIYDLLAASKMYFDKMEEQRQLEENSGSTAGDYLTSIDDFLPLTVYDMSHLGNMSNPYDYLKGKFSNNKQESLGELFFTFAMRFHSFYTTTSTRGSNQDYTFGRLEAFNFYKAVGEVNSEVFFNFLRSYAENSKERRDESFFLDCITYDGSKSVNRQGEVEQITSSWLKNGGKALFKSYSNSNFVYTYVDEIDSDGSPYRTVEPVTSHEIKYRYFPNAKFTVNDFKSYSTVGHNFERNRGFISTESTNFFNPIENRADFQLGEPLRGGTYFVIEEGNLLKNIYGNIENAIKLSAEAVEHRDTYGDSDKKILVDARDKDYDRIKENFRIKLSDSPDYADSYTNIYFSKCFVDINNETVDYDKLKTVLDSGSIEEAKEIFIKYPCINNGHEFHRDKDKKNNGLKSIYDDDLFKQQTNKYARAYMWLCGLPFYKMSVGTHNYGFDSDAKNGVILKSMLLKEGGYYWYTQNYNSVKHEGYNIPSAERNEYGGVVLFSQLVGGDDIYHVSTSFYGMKTGGNNLGYDVSYALKRKNCTKSREVYLMYYFQEWVDKEFDCQGGLLEYLRDKTLYKDGEYIYGLDTESAIANKATTESGRKCARLQEKLRNLFFKVCTQFDYYHPAIERQNSEAKFFLVEDYDENRMKDGFRGFMDQLEFIYKDIVENLENNNYSSIYEGIARSRMQDPFQNEDLKLSTYMTMKNLYDKWICAFEHGRESFKFMRNMSAFSRPGEGGVDLDNFLYCDTYFHDIGDELSVNVTSVGKWIIELMPSSDMESENGQIMFRSKSIYEFLAEMAELVGAYLMAIPQRMMYTDTSAIKDAFTPIPACLEGDWDSDTSTYMLLYTYKNSEHLGEAESESNIDMNGWSPDGDGFMVTDDDIIGRIFDDEGWYVPAFGVTFGKQNQSYFKNVSLSSSSPGVTEASISTTMNIASKASTEVRNMTLFGQDIYKVYSNYSYECTVEMLGCMQIFPPMYFQLNNIPMWKGAYMIQSVKHSIRPGDITTTIKGVRQNKYAIPMRDSNMLAFPASEGWNGTANAYDTNVTSSSIGDSGINGVAGNNIQGNRSLSYPDINMEPEIDDSNITELKPLICFTPAHSTKDGKIAKSKENAWSQKLIDKYIIPKLKMKTFRDGTSYAKNIHRCKSSESADGGYSLRETRKLINKYGSKCVISIVPHWNGGGRDKSGKCFSLGGKYHSVWICNPGRHEQRNDSIRFSQYIKAAAEKVANRKEEFKSMPVGMMDIIPNKIYVFGPDCTDPGVLVDCACVLSENWFPDYRTGDVCFGDPNYAGLDSDNRFNTGRGWLESDEGCNAVADLHVDGIVNYINSLSENSAPLVLNYDGGGGVKTNTGLVAYCMAQLGRPYWWGGYGQTATTTLLEKSRAAWPDHYSTTAEPRFENQLGQKVHDCVGLIKGYMWTDGPDDGNPVVGKNGFPGVTSDKLLSISKVKGAMANMPEVAGLAVFKEGHVGVYIGNGWVIEAMGHAYGVVKTKLESGGWKYWAYIDGIKYN